jgi:hypothetical protein
VNHNLHYIERSCDFAAHRCVADSDRFANEGGVEEPDAPGLQEQVKGFSYGLYTAL